MAQPHEYVGDGSNPPAGTADKSYEESYQAKPFACYSGSAAGPAAGKWVPGCSQEYTRVNWHRYYDDTGVGTTASSSSGIHKITSITANPAPHVEYGRIGAN